MVRAKKITDNMAIAAAHSLANFAEKRGIHPDNIVPNMNEVAVFPEEAADVAMQAIKDGVARVILSRGEALEKATKDINQARAMTQSLVDNNFIKQPPFEILQQAIDWAIEQVS